MICFRSRPTFSDDWTNASFDGDDEEGLCLIVLNVLRRNGWEVLISIDEGDFIPLDES